MNLKEFRRKLQHIKKEGYIETLRIGNTGVGHTLEQKLGLVENNIAGPDLKNIELKSIREGVSNRVTMFTFNRGVWKINQKDLVERYGYIDSTGRKSLYCTVSSKPNQQGLFLKVIKNKLCLQHTSQVSIAEWKVDDLIETFNSKMPNLIVVIAKTKVNAAGKEEFEYNKAYYLQKANREKFQRYLRKGIVVVDVRMHLKNDGSVRNHGTAFRIEEKDVPHCFKKKTTLL